MICDNKPILKCLCDKQSTVLWKSSQKHSTLFVRSTSSFCGSMMECGDYSTVTAVLCTSKEQQLPLTPPLLTLHGEVVSCTGKCENEPVLCAEVRMVHRSAGSSSKSGAPFSMRT